LLGLLAVLVRSDLPKDVELLMLRQLAISRHARLVEPVEALALRSSRPAAPLRAAPGGATA